MRKQKYYLRLTDAEHHLIFQCLLEYRNKLTSQGKYTDGVDGTHNQLCKMITGTRVNLSCLLVTCKVPQLSSANFIAREIKILKNMLCK